MQKNPKRKGFQKTRRQYLRPALSRAPLRPEEAVLGNCKVSGSAGPTAADCLPGGSACSTLAS